MTEGAAGDPEGLSGDADDLPDEQAFLPEGIRIRTAGPDDRLDVVRVLDGAMLQTNEIPERIEADDVLVAVAERGTGDDAERGAETVVGAAVLETRGEDRHLDAVAVRRARRDRGIGSALVVRAVRDARVLVGVSRVTAEFDADLREFYAGLGFAVEPVSVEGGVSPERLRGTLPL
ncbi:GNAT family N-acetyltransferase [Haloparvum sp. PAK95]|uniref:GNAT family N-acetyltransferase n=1 Tax=Haloparvum sp. PAK95 TaxID=3418962 RepID=UPI003D2EA624